MMELPPMDVEALPPEGDRRQGTKRELLTTTSSGESQATVEEANANAAATAAAVVVATLGDMRTTTANTTAPTTTGCDNRASSTHNNQQRRRRRNRRQSSHYSKFSSAAATLTAVQQQEEEKVPTNSSINDISSESLVGDNSRKPTRAPLTRRLGQQQHPVWSSPTSDYYSSSSASQNSPLQKQHQQQQTIRLATRQAANFTKIYENPILSKQNAREMMINNSIEMRPNQTSAPAPTLNWRAGGNRIGTSASSTTTATNGNNSNYAASSKAAEVAADDIHAGSTCSSSSKSSAASESAASSSMSAATTTTNSHRSSLSSSNFSAAAATALKSDQLAAAAAATARKQKRQEHLVVVHSSPSDSSSQATAATISTTTTTTTATTPTPNSVARITSKGARQTELNLNIGHQPKQTNNSNNNNNTNRRKVVTESDQRYDFVADDKVDDNQEQNYKHNYRLKDNELPEPMTAMRPENNDSSIISDDNNDIDSYHFHNAVASLMQQRNERHHHELSQQQQQTYSNYQKPRQQPQQQEDDYHFYQVVVPAEQEVVMPVVSPCRSIQRIVSSLFNQQQQQQQSHITNDVQQQQHHQLSAIPTIDQNLVNNEPLIRSSSWQNKTLIDLSRHSLQPQPPALSTQQQRQPRYARFPTTLQHQAPPPPPPPEVAGEHLYCGLNTLNSRSHYNIDGQHHHHQQAKSFQTLNSAVPADYKQRHLFNQVQMAPDTSNCYPTAGARSAPVFAASASGGGSFSSDSALGFTLANSKKRRSRGLCSSILAAGGSGGGRFWLIIMLLFGALALALLALFSSRPSFPQLQPSEQNANKVEQLDLYRTAGGMVRHQPNELLFNEPSTNQNLHHHQQQMNHHHPYRVPVPPSVFDTGAVVPSGGAVLQYNKQNPVLILQPQDPAIMTPAIGAAPTTTTPVSTTTTISEQQLLASTQNYWQSNDLGVAKSESWCAPNGNECNLRGQCDRGQCYCLAGYSGPTCAKANCPNDCSQRGECKLRTDQTIANLGALAQQNDQLYSRAYLQSLGYETLASSVARNSICPGKLDTEVNQTWAIRQQRQQQQQLQEFAYDNRLEWQCSCQAGFTGADCSQLQELRCDDQLDDDQDGLIDCEDDDCCSQPVCRDNLMCLKSPDPTRVLLLLQQQSSSTSTTTQQDGGTDFFARVKFLIANESVQLYAHENAFDKSRVAVIRGRVIKWIHSLAAANGDQQQQQQQQQEEDKSVIVSVRVGIENAAQFGFTLTRQDGYFDMLVNGNEWLTLQFHRNAYAPIKRKIFVRGLEINTLDEDIEMALASSSTGQQQQQQQFRSLDSSFGSTLGAEIYRLTSSLKRDDEQKRNALFDCLTEGVQQQQASFKIIHEPTVVQPEASADLLRTIVPVSQDGFQTHLDVDPFNKTSSNSEPLRLVYNSAMFPPAASVVKPVITIKLLDEQTPINNLESIHLRLDIEGQSRRELLMPVPNLSYQFAWNRRNVYDQKVYGYGELRIRVGYQYRQPTGRPSMETLWRECAQSIGEERSLLEQPATLDKVKQILWSNPELERQQLVWFERKVHLEAHQLNQHADLGKWNLAQSNRLHLDRKTVYFGSGWSLPYQLVYPPTLSEPISLLSSSSNSNQAAQPARKAEPTGRPMARGPNSSMFLIVHQDHTGGGGGGSRLIQLDASGKRRLIDVPLSIIASKLVDQSSDSTNNNKRLADFQLLYNNYVSTLYVGSTAAAKIVQVSYSSLLVLNKTAAVVASSSSSSSEDSPSMTATVTAMATTTMPADDELVDIEPLCGFGRQMLGSSSRHESVRSLRSTRLLGPHSMTLDEEHQVLYFIDGSTNLVALDLQTRHATLLYPSSQQQQQQQQQKSSFNWQQQQQQLSAGGVGGRNFTTGSCAPTRFAYSEFKPHNMHSLTWVRQESSLYFVDQNTVLALRQDHWLEVLAAGPQSPWQASCFGAQDNQYQLGLIKNLVLDEQNGELLLVHQWISASSSSSSSLDASKKTTGHLYLAKLRVGASVGGAAAADSQRRHRRVFDLHSTSHTWDPMVLALARRASGSLDQVTTDSATINWSALARSAQSLSPRGFKPFVHMMMKSDGFNSKDSIEINSDGSIFVLDSGLHQIRLLEPYSPPHSTAATSSSSSEPFDVNINRLFGSGSGTTAHNSIGFRNPISGELMEFHADTGIQLSLTSSSPSPLSSVANSKWQQQQANNHSTTRMDFYYKILANNKADELDEDDKNDLDIQRLLINYMTSSGGASSGEQQLDQQTGGQYVRLDKIVVVVTSGGSGGSDSRERRGGSSGKELSLELVRSYTGSRFVLQSIVVSSTSSSSATSSAAAVAAAAAATRRTICEATNDYLGVLTSFRLTNKDYWTELIYDGMTYLIRDLVSKRGPLRLPTNSPGQLSSQLASTSIQQQQQQGSWTKLKRIVYDRVFFHYCNLFVVNA